MPGIDRVAAPSRVCATPQPPADWATALTAADGFAHPSWLAIFAGRAPDDRYWFTVRNPDGAIAAGVAGHLQRHPVAYAPLDPVVLSPGQSPFWPGGAASAAAESATLALPCLWLVHPGLTSFVVGPARHDRADVRSLVEGVTDWAWRQGAGSIVWPYVTASSAAADVALAGALEAAGYAPVLLTAESWLPVPAGGWDGYLAALPARRRRQVRRERRRLVEAGAATRLGDRADLVRCAELRATQRRKYGQVADDASELARLVVLTELADHCLVIVDSTSRPAAPVSFCLFCRLGPDWHAMSTGTDDGDPTGRFAYFEACFYGVIDAAAAGGARRIGYGLAATEAKRARGCDVQDITAWVRARDPAAQQALIELGAAWRTAHAAQAAQVAQAADASEAAEPETTT